MTFRCFEKDFSFRQPILPLLSFSADMFRALVGCIFLMEKATINYADLGIGVTVEIVDDKLPNLFFVTHNMTVLTPS